MLLRSFSSSLSDTQHDSWVTSATPHSRISKPDVKGFVVDPLSRNLTSEESHHGVTPRVGCHRCFMAGTSTLPCPEPAPTCLLWPKREPEDATS